MVIKDFKIIVKKIRNLELILGKNIKHFSKDEQNVKNSSRKSIVTARPIKKKQKINIKDLCFKRPGTGINPLKIYEVIGRKVKKDLRENIILRKEYLQ